jgi:hypothetical protein
MSPTGENEAYALSRQTLIDAIRALQPLPQGSVILVGAHAVYLRAPEVITGISPFTYDGDLAVNPAKIRFARHIPEHLERSGFRFRNRYGGMYERSDASPDALGATNIDVLVPEAMDHLWATERYGTADVRAALVQPGLELCLVDHSTMNIASIGSSDRGETSVEVAGVLALLVAKGWKIGERFQQGPDAFLEVKKDIADIYRLLRVAQADDIERVARSLPREGPYRGVALEGANHIGEICGPDGPGPALLSDLIGTSDEAQLILDTLETFAEPFPDRVANALAAP